MRKTIIVIAAVITFFGLGAAQAEETTLELTLEDIQGAESACSYHGERIRALEALQTEHMRALETFEAAEASLEAREAAVEAIGVPTSSATPNYENRLTAYRNLQELVRSAQTAVHAAANMIEMLEEAIVIATSNLEIAVAFAVAYEATECDGVPVNLEILEDNLTGGADS